MIPIIWVVELDLLNQRINKPPDDQPTTEKPPTSGVSTLFASNSSQQF